MAYQEHRNGRASESPPRHDDNVKPSSFAELSKPEVCETRQPNYQPIRLNEPDREELAHQY
jgi:hypothetical protein